MKRSAPTLSLLSLLLGLGVAACQPPAPDGDDLDGELTSDGEADGKSDGVFENFTFFQIRPDYRKCMYPMCGGHWVSRVNRPTTRCVDGSYQEECYVVGTEWGISGIPVEKVDGLMSSEQPLLVKGGILGEEIEDHGIYGRLWVLEAWTGLSELEGVGLFTRVRDSGIRCITAPCPNTLHEGKLNSLRSTEMDELLLEDEGVHPIHIEDAWNHVFSEDGLIVQGVRYWVWDGSWLKGRYATQFYRRVPLPDPQPE